MKRNLVSLTLALLLFCSPSMAQQIDEGRPYNFDWLHSYLQYAKENLGLVGATAALSSAITAVIFLVTGRVRAQPVQPAMQRQDALALLAAAVQIINPAAPHLGGEGFRLGGGDVHPGADSLQLPVVPRLGTQVDLTTEQQRRLQATIDQKTEKPSQSQSSAPVLTSSSTATRSEPSRTAAISASARESKALSRGSSASSRSIGQKPKVSAAVEKLEKLVARLNDVNSDTNATALRTEIIEHLQTMTPAEIGEAAQAAFFWDKMLSEREGSTFFIALTVEQLKAALANIVIIWPPRGFLELIDVIDDRIAYLLQPMGNAIEPCLRSGIVDLFVAQLRAVMDQHVLTLQNTGLEVTVRASIQKHAKFEKQMRAMLQKLKTMCKEEESLKDSAAGLLPQILAIEEALKKSLKMELPEGA